MINEALEAVNTAAHEVMESHADADLIRYLIARLELSQEYPSMYEEDDIICYLPYDDGILFIKTFSKIR